MNDNVIRQIQKESAEALLDAGLSVPLKGIRLPFRKCPFVIRVTMKRPTLAVQMRIAKLYLDMGVTSDEMARFTKEDEMRFLAEHGKAVSLMVAYTLRGSFLPVSLTAWYVRHRMEHKYLLHAFRTFTRLMGTRSFTPIIRSVERSNPMKPRLSHGKKGS